MLNTNATNFRQNAFSYFNQAIQYGEVINVNTKNGNAVVLSEEDYRGMLETLSLSAIPGMKESILASREENAADCAAYDPEEAW